MPRTVGSQTAVNLVVAGDQIALGVLAAPGGSAFAIYETIPAGQLSASALVGRLVDASGNPSGAEISFAFPSGALANHLPTESQMARLTDGTFVFAISHANANGASDLAIYHFAANGASLGAPAITTDVVATFGASLTARPDGGYDLVCALSDPVSAALTNHIITCTAAGAVVSDIQFDPQASMSWSGEAFTPAGGRVIAYTNDFDATGASSLWTLFPGASSPVGVSYPGSAGIVFQRAMLRLATDGSAFVAAAVTAADSNGYLTTDEIRVFRFRSGQPSPTLVATIQGPTGGSVFATALKLDDFALLPNGGFVIAYLTDEFPNYYKTYLRQYTAAGNQEGTDLLLGNYGVIGGTALDGPALLATTSSTSLRLYLSQTSNDQSDVFAERIIGWSPVHDFSAHGASDILLRNGSGVAFLWTMNNATVTAGAPTSVQVGANWRIKGVGDFNRDGAADLLWVYANSANAADPLNGVSYVSFQNGAAASGGGVVQQLSSAWQVAGVGDFNGDGMADVLYRNASSGQTYLDIMNGSSVNWASSGFTSQQVTDAKWQVAAVGDFNGDGNADALWRYNNASNASDPLNGTLYEWQMNGTSVTSAGLLSQQAGKNWQVAGTGDFNGDGNADILFRYNNAANASDALNGLTYVDFMNGTNVASGAPTQWQIDNSWAVASIGDYNGDGMSDVLWQQMSSGNTYVWQMNGGAVTSGAYTSSQAGTGWTVQNGVLIG